MINEILSTVATAAIGYALVCFMLDCEERNRQRRMRERRLRRLITCACERCRKGLAG